MNMIPSLYKVSIKQTHESKNGRKTVINHIYQKLNRQMINDIGVGNKKAHRKMQLTQKTRRTIGKH